MIPKKAKYQEWKAAQGNPVAANAPGGDVCFIWQKYGYCQLADECRRAQSHTPENAPKDENGEPTTKGKDKGKQKGKIKGKGKKGNAQGQRKGQW